MSERPPLHPRTWPMWLAIALMTPLVRLPLAWQRGIGAALGSLAWRLWASRRRIALRNLELCFPDWDSSRRRAVARASFRSLGLGLFEFCRAWWGSVAADRRRSRIDGIEHLDQALARGHGVLLISGHFLTLEICGRLLSEERPVAGMYRAHEQPALEWAVTRGRRRYTAAMFRREETRASLRHLKAGGILWYAPDQDYGSRRGLGLFVPFFGVPAATLSATHHLARISGASVLAFFHRRLPGGGYQLRLEPALAEFPSADVVADTARTNGLIEAMILEAPEEYLWVHKRYKNRPEGSPPLYRQSD